jgi:hypothetical protein
MGTRIVDDRELEEIRSAKLSDNSSYMKWSTELQVDKNITNDDFLYRNRIPILGLNKFAALANFTDFKMIRLHKLKMIIIDLQMSAGLTEGAEQTALSAIDDIQCSRGDRGFYQKALITQRQEFETSENTETQKRVGFFNKLFSKKEPQQQEGQQK